MSNVTFGTTYRQAIVTRYHGPTNTKGARISATASAGRVYVPYDHALNADGNHEAAATALCAKFGWAGELACGGLEWGGDRVFVFVHPVTKEVA